MPRHDARCCSSWMHAALRVSWLPTPGLLVLSLHDTLASAWEGMHNVRAAACVQTGDVGEALRREGRAAGVPVLARVAPQAQEAHGAQGGAGPARARDRGGRLWAAHHGGGDVGRGRRGRRAARQERLGAAGAAPAPAASPAIISYMSTAQPAEHATPQGQVVWAVASACNHFRVPGTRASQYSQKPQYRLFIVKPRAGVQVAFAPLPAAPKPVATKAAPAAREPSRELTASEQFLAQARAHATLQA